MVAEARAPGLERLTDALEPFVKFHDDGNAWKGTVWAREPETSSVLYDSRTGTAVTIGDFRRASEVHALLTAPPVPVQGIASPVSDAMRDDIRELLRMIDNVQGRPAPGFVFGIYNPTSPFADVVEKIRAALSSQESSPAADAVAEALIADIVWRIGNVHDLRDYAVRDPIEKAVRTAVEAFATPSPTAPALVVDEAMVRRLKKQIAEWEDDEPREDWWQWQRDVVALLAALTDALQNAGGE